jgi:hypothetical protein
VHGFKPTGLDQLDSTPVSTRSTRYHNTKQIYISSLNASKSAKSLFRVPYLLYVLLSNYLPGSVLAMATPALANAERANVIDGEADQMGKRITLTRDFRKPFSLSRDISISKYRYLHII